jgi:ABC-type uncharacterized transport system permease subunit
MSICGLAGRLLNVTPLVTPGARPLKEDTMQATVQAATHATPVIVTRPWMGRAISGLAVLFLIFDGVIKVLQLAPAVDASAQLGYSASATFGLGVLALACLAIYALPRTAILGAVLLTGYLGGAIATHVRLGSPLFSLIFPLILGAMLWGGLYLRDTRLRALVAPRQ